MNTAIADGTRQYYDLVFLGDFCPCDEARSDALTIGPKLKEILANCGCAAVNLECPLTTAETRISKTGPHLKAHPGAIRLLGRLGVKVCNMANNHIRDYGKAGIIETCAILDGNNIKHFGLWGECGNESTIIKVRDLNVGLIAFAENEFSTDKSDGCAAVGLDHSWQFKQIAALKPGTDYIIAQYHGGVEFYPYPPPNQQKYCRWLIDAGADLVICHHSHTVSGHETYSGKKIYYGLGNFFFPEAGNETDWFFGLGVGLRFDDPVTATIMPVFYDMPNNLLDLGDETRSSSLLAGINQVIDDEQLINKAWDDYCVANQNRTLMSVLRPGRFARLLIKLGLMKLSLEKQAGLSLLNLLRCESHYDRIKHTLELLNEKRENRRHS